MSMIKQVDYNFHRIHTIGLSMKTCPSNQVIYSLLLTLKLNCCLLEFAHLY